MTLTATEVLLQVEHLSATGCVYDHKTSANKHLSKTIYFTEWRRNEFERGGRKALENFSLVVPLHFLALQAQLVASVSAFVMGSTFRSVSRLLFYSWCPHVLSHL